MTSTADSQLSPVVDKCIAAVGGQNALETTRWSRASEFRLGIEKCVSSNKQIHFNLVEQALIGGMLADRLSWVFLAAYQSACRSIFPEVQQNQWHSFAVSEDPQGEVPGVQRVEDSFTGGKSWLAGWQDLDAVIVKVDDVCFCVAADHPALTFTGHKPGRFLSDLDTARLWLDSLPLADVQPLDTSRLIHFPVAECFFVMLAGCGYCMRHLDFDHADDRVSTLAGVAQTLRDIGEMDFPDHLSALNACQEQMTQIGRQLGAEALERESIDAADWAANGKLLGMYGPMLRKRL